MTWLYCSCRHVTLFLRLALIALIPLAFLPACIGLRDGTDGTETATLVSGVLSTVAPNAAPAQPPRPTAALATAGPTTVPTATTLVARATVDDVAASTSTPSDPARRFSHLRFTPTADGEAQSEFPARTEIVFALWDYEGLSVSDTMRRIWFRDDQIWITREEKWDWEEYGSAGTMRYVSVFDNEGDGLHPATYRLQLYLNDELQVEGTFIVQAE